MDPDLNSGLAALENGDHKLAIVHFEKHLAVHPDDNPTRYKLAIAFEGLGLWAKALQELAALSNYNEDEVNMAFERIKEKQHIYGKVKSIIKTQKDIHSYIGENDFVELRAGSINIKFHVKNEYLDILSILRTVKRAVKLLKDRLDFEPNIVEVEIYDELLEIRQRLSEQERHSSIGSWVGGLCGRRIMVNSSNPSSPEPQNLYVLLTHEYVHYALGEISGGCSPYWVEEGLAVYLSQELSDEYLDALRRSLGADALLPFEVVEKEIIDFTDEEARRLAYAQSCLAVEYLVELMGWPAIREILVSCRTTPAKQALANKGLSYFVFERDFKKWLKKRLRNTTL
jgi:tetratricopeptide (TPR) repeat protein